MISESTVSHSLRVHRYADKQSDGLALVSDAREAGVALLGVWG